MSTELGAAVLEYEKIYSAIRTIFVASAATLTGCGVALLRHAEHGDISASHGWIAGCAVSTLILLLLASGYGIFWFSNFLPSIFEPCYELRRLNDGESIVQLLQEGAVLKLSTSLKPPKEVRAEPYVNTPTVAGALTAKSEDTLTESSLRDKRTEWEELVTSSEQERSRVVLVVLYSDRLGNHIFQYSYARLRSMYLDVAFVSPRRLGPPFQHCATVVARHGRAPAVNAGTSPGTGARLMVVEHEQLLRDRTESSADEFVRPALRSGLQSGSVLAAQQKQRRRAFLTEPICHYAMNTQQYIGFESVIAGWLRPSVEAIISDLTNGKLQSAPTAAPTTQPGIRTATGTASVLILSCTSPHDVAIHVRLGDILWGAHAAYRPLPMSFYRSALDIIWATQSSATCDYDDAWRSREGVHATNSLTPQLLPSAVQTSPTLLPNSDVTSFLDASSSAGTRRRRPSVSAPLTAAAAASTASNAASASSLRQVDLDEADAQQPRNSMAAREQSSTNAATKRTIVIVTEDANHPIIQRMAKHLFDYCIGTLKLSPSSISIVCQSASVSGDFCTLCAAPNVVMSISSFAWWAAALNYAANRIIVPCCGMLKSHQWRPSPSRHPQVWMNHDLTMPDFRCHGGGSPVSSTNAAGFVNGTGSSANAAPATSTHPRLPSTVTPRSGVTAIDLTHLPRWEGNTPSTVDSLFD